MKNLLIYSLIVSLLLPGLSSCGTIMNTTRQNIGISSTPTGASVLIDNMPRGKTPLIADLSRKDNHLFKIEIDGYMPFEGTLTRSVSGWVWGNILFGGLIGLAVDAISGGLYKLTPDQVATVMQKEQMGTLYKMDRIYIGVVLKADPSWQKIATLQPIVEK